jgi:hypothetical protein
MDASEIGQRKLLTLTSGLFHVYEQPFPENKHRRLRINETKQKRNENAAMVRVRILDLR